MKAIKFKKMAAILLSCIMAFGVFTALPLGVGAAESAADEVGSTTYTSGDYEYQLLDDGTAEITGYTGSATELTIPLRLGGYEVTSIGNYAFSGCSGLTSVTIPNSITSIGYDAFSYCYNLMSIAIPDSVTYISDRTFRFCSNLTSITIPDSVTGIGNNAFELCMNLKSITISNSVANIGDYVFACCYDLTNVSIPDSVKTIGEKAFGYNISEFGDSGKVDNFTIYGYSGTAAETYANDNGFTFVAIDGTTEPSTEPAEVKLGDVNGDGVVDISDATAIQKAVAKITSLTDSQTKAADVNGDGTIDISDATMIQKYVAKIITSFTTAK